MDVINLDSAGLAQHLVDFLAGMEYLRGQNQALRETFTALAPPRGEIPSLSDFINPLIKGVAEDAIVVFGVAAALRGAADPAIELQKNLEEVIGEIYPGKSVLDSWRGDEAPLSPLDKSVTEAIAMIRSGAHLEPRTLWEIGLRLFERIRQSNFRKTLVPLLADWMAEQWKRIIANETFRLTRPTQTVPAIETILASGKKSEAVVASLLLTGAEAVGSPLAAEYEKQLREISAGDR